VDVRGWFVPSVNIVLVHNAEGLSVPAAGEFLEELFVECLAFVERSHRHEHISTDEFVDDLAVGAEALEHDLLITVFTAQFNLQYTCRPVLCI